jgi:integrase
MTGAVRKARLGQREVRALGPNEMIWDTSVAGFGARRQRGDAVTYVLKVRIGGVQRWLKIGRHGAPWSPDSARAEARWLLGELANGRDPTLRREPVTVAELCSDYLSECESGTLLTRRGAPKKLSTVKTDRSRVEAQIIPLLGQLDARQVSRRDIERFLADVIGGKAARRVRVGVRALSNVRGGKGAAARTVGLLGAIFTFAVRLGLRDDNPVRGVIRPADGRRTHRLQLTDYRALGGALDSSDLWPNALAAIRFLSLTGWRRGEVLALRWSEVDLPRRTARLADTKTGESMRPLSRAAVAVLRWQRRLGGKVLPDGLIFPARRSDRLIQDMTRVFARLVKRADLPSSTTCHTLRHSFASVAADVGLSEPVIASLIGHKGVTITSRYVHTADAVLLAAADTVAKSVRNAMRQRARPSTTP